MASKEVSPAARGAQAGFGIACSAASNMEFMPTTPATQDLGAGLPALIDRAARALSSARTSAEILEAKIIARIAYDSAQRAARFAEAKGAHDSIVAAAHRAQADALEIEALAKRRLADEYDAAQERGEIVGAHDGARKRVPDGNAIVPATAEDVGLTRKIVFEARQIRDAEAAQPGIIRQTLDNLLDAGEEPTRTAVKRQIGTAKRFAKNSPAGENINAEPGGGTSRIGRPQAANKLRAAEGHLSKSDPARRVIAEIRRSFSKNASGSDESQIAAYLISVWNIAGGEARAAFLRQIGHDGEASE